MSGSETLAFFGFKIDKSIAIELVSGGFTFILGLISFKILEKYRNRKDNNKLYIQIIKLKEELESEKSKITELLNEYIKREILEKDFYINGIYNHNLYVLYNDIMQIAYDHIRQESYWIGDEVGCDEFYEEIPHQLIENLSFEINMLEHEGVHNSKEIKQRKELLEIYESQLIYDKFRNIAKRFQEFIEQDCKLNDAIIFLHVKLQQYNSLPPGYKRKHLDKFCRLIFEDDNIFVNSLKDFKRLKALKEKQSSENINSRLDVNFRLWETIGIDLLALHDAEIYLEIDELYSELKKIEVRTNCEDTLRETYDILGEKLEPIILKLERKFKKTLKRVNKS